jgi:hypothetical protein
MPDNTDANALLDSIQPEGSLPFFARFLEGQNREERSAATLKYPSDLDEYQTMKYPSDGDDDQPVDSNTFLSGADERMSNQTLKYPSDRDEWEPFLNS